MRNISITKNHSFHHHTLPSRHLRTPSNLILPSFRTSPEIYIPPLNLTQPSHSFHPDKSQNLLPPSPSPLKQQRTSYTQRTQSDRYTTYEILTQRRNLEEILLIDNKQLRRQNQQLKREINQFKQIPQSPNSTLQHEKQQILHKISLTNDSKNKSKINVNIQKEVGLYKEIIERLERRVEILLEENGKLKMMLEENEGKLGEVEGVWKEYVVVKKGVEELEEMIRRDDREWGQFKVRWLNEKEYYVRRIERLEAQLKNN